MIYELNHVGILTDDLEATLRFYRACGAQVVFDRMIRDSPVRIVYVQLGGGLLEFIGVPPGQAAPGIDHLAVLTDSLEADHTRLLGAGAVEAVAPKPAGTGEGRQSFVLWGDARLELIQRDVEMRVPHPEDSLVVELDHFALTVPDLPGAAAFFTEAVGLAPLTGIDLDGRPVRRFLHLGEDALGLGAEGTARAPGVFPYVSLRVEDVDAVLAELARRGFDGLGTAEDSFTGDSRCAVITAPDGVRLELLDRPALSAASYRTD
ncbi:VOC family protein [Brachybacterium saurashtrense]|uniref:VOC family protein n=1 Tax=Brachybacterium saurashtrense TaxID=556288 RepID=A0A345YP87_9MICO|nr:VOC family protein [Brachybacterium saurashtrense]AXK45739.1 VOC family protein [Brachybacterium saurashtrense]RRR24757.1 VOC family protein [Brachybacterium saurashtrense]